ncbi:MAG: Arginine-tRNA ligase [Candidatus Nomurabacteria bacterium GW2011_GWA2_35_80]|uniref:arginine--tRNA ligase n=1 Tax=Candidatus Nomurabacteria bacterium GW2011_GWA2_35_80 TaxID=1618733 RepID=A0A0G0DHK0_9BACT|nr:MAG: Arginine-tRNA ligase [Candidatus Nomurabacteria bacterium GW2011_GWA2_35_80]
MNIKEKIEDLIKNTLKSLNIEAKDIRPDEHPFGRVSLEHPVDLEMGDFSTNIAMVLAKENKTNPKELAEKIVKKLNKNLPTEVLKIQIAGAGFINFYLPKEFFVNSTREILENKNFGRNNIFEGKKVMVEYTQPNPFKPFHIGHLMSNTIGESISRIVEFSGAKMVRANYQGDIGPHVAKAIYELLKSGLPEEDKKSDKKINEIYDWGRRITLEAFEEIYKILGTSFNYYFFESIVAPIGEKIVSSSDVFEKSDGAIVFRAEKYNPKLHTRVFITSQGLPTYETKELGLTKMKFEKENLDLSVVITAHEQEEYMKVVNKALEIISPEFASKMKHVVHGMMRLASGKMSSRKGNVITGESLILESCDEILKKIENRDFTEEEKKQISKDVGVSALKYSILKQNIGGDIIYDFEKSISFEGDSGPYLQYSFARANSVLEKAKKENILPGFMSDDFAPTEVEKLLYRFPEIVFRSAQEFEPHYIANYLIDIARAYNTYYGSTKIIDKNDPTSPYKVALTLAFSLVIKNGLYLLGIKAPERM